MEFDNSFDVPLPPAQARPVNPDVRYVGGYDLQARGTDFLTGLSDLQLFPDGDGLRAEAVSDYGAIALFDLRPDAEGGFQDSELSVDPLRDADGEPYYDKRFGDAEDIAYDPRTGAHYVSFEGYQRVMRYTDWHGRGETLRLSGLPPFPSNEGMEGLTFIHETGGDSLLIGVESGGFWRCGLALNVCTEIHGPATPGFLYMMTSLAVVDYGDPRRDHDILGLYRYYDPITGPRNVLRLLHLEGDTLTFISDMVKITPPLPVDNFEGVAAIKTAAGYRIFLISDSLKEGGKPKLLIFDWTP